jgi:hypothetical protein
MKKFLKVCMFTLVVLGGASVLFVPILSRVFLTRIAVREARRLLNTEVRIAHSELRLLEGRVIAQGIEVFHPDRKNERIIEVARAGIQIKPWPILFGKLAHVEFEIEAPKLVYATTKSGQWELSKRIPMLMRGEGEKRLPVNIDEITIKDGEVDYRDGKVGLTTKVTDIDVKVRNVRLPTQGSPLPSTFKMDFDIGGGGDFSMTGKADFLSSKISFESDANLTGLPLPRYAPYYDKGLPVRITRGSMAMTSHARCEQDYLKAPAHVVISGLAVEPKQAKIFGFAANTVVDSLKDRNGRVEMDMMISGNIRNPQFHVMTDLTAGFVKSLSKGLVMAIPNQMGEALKGAGEGVKKGTESGLDKLRGIFK